MEAADNVATVLEDIPPMTEIVLQAAGRSVIVYVTEVISFGHKFFASGYPQRRSRCEIWRDHRRGHAGYPGWSAMSMSITWKALVGVEISECNRLPCCISSKSIKAFRDPLWIIAANFRREECLEIKIDFLLGIRLGMIFRNEKRGRKVPVTPCLFIVVPRGVEPRFPA